MLEGHPRGAPRDYFVAKTRDYAWVSGLCPSHLLQGHPQNKTFWIHKENGPEANVQPRGERRSRELGQLSGNMILLLPKAVTRARDAKAKGLRVGARLEANAFGAGLSPRLREHYFPYSCAHFGAGKQTSRIPRLLDRNPTRGVAVRLDASAGNQCGEARWCEAVYGQGSRGSRVVLSAKMGRGQGWETAERHTHPRLKELDAHVKLRFWELAT